MILWIPINAIAAQRMKLYQRAQMKSKDHRSRLVDELLNGIKVIKLYAWEKQFKGGVMDVRMKEMAALLKMAYLQAVT